MTEQQTPQGQEPADQQQNPSPGQAPTEQQQNPSPSQEQTGLPPAATAAELAEARREAANYRTQRNEHEQRATQLQQQFDQMRSGFARALGFEQEEPDAGALQGQLQQTQAQYRRERLQNVVLTDSLRQGADPGLTWAHLFATGALDDLDIQNGAFTGVVTERVAAAMEANPKLRADYAPGAPPASAQQPANVGGGSNPPSAASEQLPEVNPFRRETFNLTEQARITQANPDLARRLQNAAKA